MIVLGLDLSRLGLLRLLLAVTLRVSLSLRLLAPFCLGPWRVPLVRLQQMKQVLVPAVLLKFVEQDQSASAALLLILGTHLNCDLLPVLAEGLERPDEPDRVLFSPLG